MRHCVYMCIYIYVYVLCFKRSEHEAFGTHEPLPVLVEHADRVELIACDTYCILSRF
jgi:hypothetical protein